MGERPNRNYAILAHPVDGGFTPAIRMRGKVGVERVSDDEYGAPDDARLAAAEALLSALNGRTRSKRKHGYGRLSGADLSEALADLGITPTEFGILYGTTVERVLTWIDNAEDIPHPVRVMLEMFRIPGALDAARRATREAIEEKEETTDA